MYDYSTWMHAHSVGRLRKRLDLNLDLDLDLFGPMMDIKREVGLGVPLD